MKRHLAPCQWRGTRRGQHGALAVETALVLPILLGIGLIGSDMMRIHVERIRIENAAGTMALNLAAQPELTAAGLDALAEAAMQGHSDHQQLIILNVRQSGRIAWALQRGGASSLCKALAKGGLYSGSLPEQRPSEEGQDGDADNSTLSMIVVRACRDTRDIALSGGLTLPSVLDTTSIFRATSTEITLDDTLQAESKASGLAYSSP